MEELTKQIVANQSEKIATIQEGDFSLFAEEMRRAQRYDERVCPQEYRECMNFSIKKGHCVGSLLRKFGKRKLPEKLKMRDIETVVETHNFVEQQRKKCKALPRYNLCGLTAGIEVKILEELIKDGKTGRYFVMDEKRKGFSLIFGRSNSSLSWMENNYEGDVYGIPEMQRFKADYDRFHDPTEDRAQIETLRLGTISLEFNLGSTARRRFTYTFGLPPIGEDELITALVEINQFKSYKDENSRHYFLKPVELESVPHPRGAELSYAETVEAKKQGLFRDVVVFELKGRDPPLPKKDPVIVGVDPFGFMYPILYWAGDKSTS